MVQVFMQKSNTTTETVSVVEGRVKIIDKFADAYHKSVLELKCDMSSRIGSEEDLQFTIFGRCHG